MSPAARKKSLFLPSTLRPFAPQISLLGFASLILLILTLNVFFPQVLVTMRVGLIDLLTPLLQLVGAPGDMLGNTSMNFKDIGRLREENESMRKEIAELKSWRDAATQLAQENKELKALLKYKDDSAISFLTARVLARAGGDFTKSVIVTAGARDGVIKDMVALTEDGVIGRVIEVGEWSARVLLMNDFSFRLPVLIEDTKEQAILTGAGEEAPRLLYLPIDANVKPGMQILTSGHGGIFPPYLPVGRVAEVKGREVFAAPYATPERLQIVRLVQYNIPGVTGKAENKPAEPAATPENKP